MSAHYTNIGQDRVSRILPDLVRHRYLLWDLVSKELRARYRNAMMGFLWAVLHPVLMMLILTLVFGFLFQGKVAKAGTQYPFPPFLLCGLVPWQFFSAALIGATNSLLQNQDLIKKVNFPREVIPLAAIGNLLVNFFIGVVVLLVVHLAYGGALFNGTGLLWLPVVFAVLLMLTTGLALLFSSLNIYYNDVLYAVEVALAFGFYATPIFYDLSLVTEFAAETHRPWLAALYELNPMAGLVDVTRQALLDNHVAQPGLLVWPAICAAVILMVGAAVFRRRAPVFADQI